MCKIRDPITKLHVDYVIVLLESSILLGILEGKTNLLIKHILLLRNIDVEINRIDKKILIINQREVR